MPERDLIPARGRPSATLLLTVERELTAADLYAYATNPPAPIGRPRLQRLRSVHHAAARHLATGNSIVHTALATGFSQNTISDYLKDPAFADLVSFYQAQVTEIDLSDGARMQTTLVDIAELAAGELKDRLEDDEKRSKMPMSELRQVAQLALDRTVAPPKAASPSQTAPLKITFNIGNRDIRPKDAETGESSTSVTVENAPVAHSVEPSSQTLTLETSDGPQPPNE